MDIPLHPVVVTEIRRGRELLDRVRSAREEIAGAQVRVGFPDGGEGSILFDGEGMVIAADFPADLFTRYPTSTALSDVLTQMCRDAYTELGTAVSGAVAAAVADLT